MNSKLSWFTRMNFAIVALFILLVFSQANKNFVLDEVDFPAVAASISESGLPYEYRGETEPHALGLWHPPLYAYSLGGFVKMFGLSENTVRAFGLLCTMLSALLCLLIYKELFQKTFKEASCVSTVFLSLFLLHPYTIANTTLPDIDSTILPVTILCFIYGLIKSFEIRDDLNSFDWPLRNSIFMSFLFALNLWAKMTTPLVLIPTLAVILCVKGLPFLKSISNAVTVLLLGGSIFLITYGIYCYLLALPFDFTFSFLVASFTKNSTSSHDLSAVLSGIISHLAFSQYFINWMGLIFTFTFFLAFFVLILREKKTDSEYVFIVLVIFGIFVSAFYLGLTGAFGGFFKYIFPVFPILVLMISHYIYTGINIKLLEAEIIEVSFQNKVVKISHKQTIGMVFVLVFFLMAIYQLFVAKDNILIENAPIHFSLILLIIIAAMGIAIATVRKSESLLLSYAVISIFAVIVGTDLGVSRSQAVATYPTKYHYGQLGFNEAISYLKGNLKPNEVIWSMKDIGHYSSGHYIENYGTIFKNIKDIKVDLDGAIKKYAVRYLIVTSGIGQDRVDAYPDLKTALDDCCEVDRIFGNFVIYKAKLYE